MSNGDRLPVTAEGVTFRRLRRANHHRTSVPTNDALRRALWELSRDRPGREPYMDAVILAAVRVATDHGGSFERLRSEVARIEDETFTVTLGPGHTDPGEPSS